MTKYPTGPHQTPHPAQLTTAETVRQKTYPKPAAYTGTLELKYYLQRMGIRFLAARLEETYYVLTYFIII